MKESKQNGHIENLFAALIELKDLINKILESFPEKVTTFDDLSLTVRTFNLLRANGISSILHLSSKSETDLLKIPNIGKRAVNEIRNALSEIDIDLPVSRKYRKRYTRKQIQS